MTGLASAGAVGRPRRIGPSAPTSSRRAPRSGASRSTTTSAVSASPTSCPRPARWSASTGTSPRPTRSASSWPSGPAARRTRTRWSRSSRRSSASACGSSRCCSSAPEIQAAGVGRALLARVMPPGGTAGDAGPMTMATATDSAQPISNALYATYGIVPRIPLLEPLGLAERPEAFGPLPSGVTPVPFEAVAGRVAGRGRPPRAGRRRRRARPRGPGRRPPARPSLPARGVAARLALPRARRRRRSATATRPRRVGSDRSPSATRTCWRPVLGHLTTAVQPRGAFALWLPGSADRAVVPALRAGFRLDQFPILLCWDRPFADFAATCRSPPACSSERTRPHRTGPSSGARLTARHVCRARGRVVASGHDVAPLAVPADGVLLARAGDACRRTSHPRSRPVTIAPAPTAARSLRERVLRRPNEQADPGTRGPRAARRHQAVPQRQGGAPRRRPRHPRRRLRLPRRPVGRRQVDAHQAAHPRRDRDPGRRRARRPGPRPAAAPPGPEDAPQDRDHLPGLQAAADQDGLGERRVRARGDRHAAPPDHARRSTACWRWSG